MTLADLNDAYTRDEKRILDDFFSFLRFESVSSEPAYQSQVVACFDWLRTYVERMGFATERWDTDRHPVLFARLAVDPKKPTVLIYNHYDVQPVDPLSLWESPPFAPTVRDGEIYARGAQDNKGQCFYVLTALRKLIESAGRLPVNIKLCIEGEEEIGSPGLAKLLEAKREDLRADHLFIVDLGFHSPAKPAVTLGLRGLVAMTVELTGSSTDMHSGSHGGVVVNPNHALIGLLSKLRNDAGQILVPGFYDQVTAPLPDERQKINFAFNDSEYHRNFGADPVGGEHGYSPLERAWVRPTLEINGIGGGYSGAGFKTVIPAKAIAKISCRLVPNQDPNHIGDLVAQFLRDNAPAGVHITVDVHPGVGQAVRTTSNTRVVKAVSQAYAEVTGRTCEYILEGASIPVVVELARISGGDLALMGYGLPDDRIHAPNEHFGIERLRKGYLTIARSLQLLGS